MYTYSAKRLDLFHPDDEQRCPLSTPKTFDIYKPCTELSRLDYIACTIFATVLCKSTRCLNLWTPFLTTYLNNP